MSYSDASQFTSVTGHIDVVAIDRQSSSDVFGVPNSWIVDVAVVDEDISSHHLLAQIVPRISNTRPQALMASKLPFGCESRKNRMLVVDANILVASHYGDRQLTAEVTRMTFADFNEAKLPEPFPF